MVLAVVVDVFYQPLQDCIYHYYAAFDLQMAIIPSLLIILRPLWFFSFSA